MTSYVCLTSVQAQIEYDPAQVAELRPIWPGEVSLFHPTTLVTDTYHINVPAHARAKVLEISGKFITIQIRQGRAMVPLEETDFLWRLEEKVDAMMKKERALSESYFPPPDNSTAGAVANEESTKGDSRQLFLQGIIYLRIGKKIEDILKEERDLGVTASSSHQTNPRVAGEANSVEDLPPVITPELMNKMLGLPLWSRQRLWSEPVAAVADRLDWPQDASGVSSTAYRYYPQHQMEVLGVKPFCLTLHAAGGQAREVVLVFTNQFDPASFQISPLAFTPTVLNSATVPAADPNLVLAVNNDAWAVSLALTRMLGMPRTQPLAGDDNHRDLLRRWDWAGNAFLLAVAPGKYAVLRIVPADRYDEAGQPIAAKIQLARPLLVRQAEHRPNGDMVVSGIPMVNQGHNDFCGPATWERYLRYQGVPADMYMLGVSGHAGLGGGLLLFGLEGAVQNLVNHYGRQIEPVDPVLTIPHLAAYLDRGIPLVWACNSPPSLEREITERSQRRKDYGNWPEYKKESLAFQQHYAQEFPADEGQSASAYSHLRLIIGYNPDTKEIAISDSYGAWAQERWMTLLEANAVSLGYVRVIK